MAAGDNRLGLIFEIAADPSKAESALSEFAGRANAIEAELAAAKKSLAANQNNYNEALREGDAASREIVADMAREREAVASLSAELAEVKRQMKSTAEAEQGIGGGIYESLNDLRRFRSLFAATIGFASFGFWFVEWGRLLEGIQSGISYLEGFGSAAQKAFAELVKGADDALIHVGGLTTAQKIASTQALIAQTEQRINLDETTRAALASQSYWHNLAAEIKGVVDALGGNTTPLALFASKFSAKSGASLDEQNANLLLQKQMKALQELQKQLQQEQQKSAHAAEVAAHKQATAAQHAAAAAERAARQKELAEERAERAAEVAFQKEYRAGHEFADKLARSFEKAYDARQRAEAKAAADLARGPQGAKGGIPGVTGAAAQAHDAIAQAAIKAVPPLNAERQAVLALNDALIGTTTALQHVKGEMGIAVAFQQQFGNALGANIAQAIVYGQSISKAMESALKATLASISAQAMVRAIFETAVGFADLFVDPPAAAAAFESAAIFASIGGVTAGLGAAIPGGGGGGGGSRHMAGGSGSGSHYEGGGASGRSSGQQLVPGGNLPAVPKNGNLTISIMGDQEAGQWLANTLNTVVQQGGATLTATRTTAIPNPLA